MKALHALFLSVLSLPLAAEVQPVEASRCGRIPDALGRAGMAAVGLSEGGDRMMMAGGANFPHAQPGARTAAERGAKEFYADVWVACPDGSLLSSALMPYPVGYAAFAPIRGGMLVAGGCNASGHLSRCVGVRLGENGRVGCFSVPDLPLSVAYPAFAVQENKLYVMGGQERADSVECLSRVFALDLSRPEDGWKELASMPDARMLAGAASVNGRIYVAGGCSLHPDAQGKAERAYLNTVLCYDVASNTWSCLEQTMPETMVGAPNPLPVADGSFYIVGGDPGNFYRASLAGQTPAEHPGQSATVYSFTPASGRWLREGENSLGVATAPSVQFGNTIHTISGETHPGVRTPIISTINIESL